MPSTGRTATTPTREAIEGCPSGRAEWTRRTCRFVLARTPPPPTSNCQSPHPRRACWRASTTKSARVPTNSSQTSSCTPRPTSSPRRATGREGPPFPSPPSHSMRPARGQTGPWPPRPLEGATARCSRVPTPSSHPMPHPPTAPHAPDTPTPRPPTIPTTPSEPSTAFVPPTAS